MNHHNCKVLTSLHALRPIVVEMSIVLILSFSMCVGTVLYGLTEI